MSNRKYPDYQRFYMDYEEKPRHLLYKDFGLTPRLSKKYLEEDLKKYGNVMYFDAGTLPEVVVTPPNDNAVNKVLEIFRDENLKLGFYEDLENLNTDKREYINRLYLIFMRSKSPKIKSTDSKTNIVIPMIEALTGGRTDRANYNPVFNIMYVSPKNTLHDTEAELAHAFLYYSKDYKNGLLQTISSLPADIKINGKTGYDRPGNIEHSAHSIVEPLIHSYLTDTNIEYQDVVDFIQDMRANPEFYFGDNKNN